MKKPNDTTPARRVSTDPKNQALPDPNKIRSDTSRNKRGTSVTRLRSPGRAVAEVSQQPGRTGVTSQPHAERLRV
ncbi:hypothetical protein BDDG_12292 [Blastomyces dermatitidis ATCC 18188]|uniref:Uncharacterized protein n=1 Tax=Ajellomyces dermatitidis (strain ATCC 18188 / CBS 674.68) TaxID=653446 RepID=A0A0J9ENX3_AJEDA|nr:hypothetical protein BDFG_05114 [Blastomyces dermatitidis ATCC 26199]KMW67746.1 hypothetical protein BDDG_12292 [Blastomyces dermatitidis ATCC 18188]